jgi:hypothetical protein
MDLKITKVFGLAITSSGELRIAYTLKLLGPQSFTGGINDPYHTVKHVFVVSLFTREPQGHWQAWKVSWQCLAPK